MLRCLSALFLMILASQALADPQSKSWSSWSLVAGGIEARYTIASRELTRLGNHQLADQGPAQLILAELESNLLLDTKLGNCKQAQAELLASKPGFVRWQLRWQCPADAVRVTLSNTALLRVAPSHIHFARFNLPDQAPFERLFSRGASQHQIVLRVSPEMPLASSSSQVALIYTTFGFEHILIGLDHIAFLLGLLLLSRGLGDVLLVVTGFTLGHSITLGITALGLLTPQQTLVEGLIGFTIVMVAVENLLSGDPRQQQAAVLFAVTFIGLALLALVTASGPAPASLLGLGVFSYCYLKMGEDPRLGKRLRPALSVLFGLIHGFGFAAVLLEVGLPGSDILPALLGFNLGVELGQLTLVLALGLLAMALSRLHKPGANVLQLALNTGLCGLGTFWFVERMYFPG
jgi:hypothetical protein